MSSRGYTYIHHKTEPPLSKPAFTDLDLPQNLLDGLESIGYQSMTPVQSKVLPPALTGRDVIAKAKTGSGKTVSFGLLALANLYNSQFEPQTLVLCPTRELADQITEVIRQLARATPNVKVLTLTGGSSVRTQISSLQNGSHIIVGTPGRIEDHLGRGTLLLEKINTLVLDEADRMLQMGFQESIDRIIEQLPDKRQTRLLSATWPDEIKSIAKRFMHSPTEISVDTEHSSGDIQQHFYPVEKHQDRSQALQLLLLKFKPENALIFCNTKIAVNEVTDFLKGKGFAAIALHGDLEQKDRDRNLIRFANRSATILVATDVAARGIDIEKLDVVINYQLSKETDIHTHRSGRTGRAGEAGMVWTLFDNTDTHRLEQLAKVLGQPIKNYALPRAHALKEQPVKPATVTLEINAGKKQKLRPGDILGALTGDGGLEGSAVGKIKILNTRSFVAIDRNLVKKSQERLQKIKGRSFRTRVL